MDVGPNTSIWNFFKSLGSLVTVISKPIPLVYFILPNSGISELKCVNSNVFPVVVIGIIILSPTEILLFVLSIEKSKLILLSVILVPEY